MINKDSKVVRGGVDSTNKSKYKVLINNTVIFAVGNFLIKIINFLLMPLYTLAMTAAEYCEADLLNNAAELILPIATLCISDAVFRLSISDDVDNEKLLTNGFLLINIGAEFVFVIGLLVSKILHYKYSMLLVAVFIFKSYNSLFSNYTRGSGRNKLFVTNGILGAVLLCGFSYLFLNVFHMGVSGYCFAIIIADFTCGLFLVFMQSLWNTIKKQKLDKQLLKMMILYSAPLIPNALSWWFTNVSSRYIILVYYDESVVGLFSAASKLPALINMVSNIFQQAWQFSSTKEFEHDNDDDFYAITFSYYSMLIMIFSSIIITVVPYIALVILKNEFYKAWIYVPLLIYSAAVGSIAYFFGTFFAVAKKNVYGMITTMLGAFVNVLVSFVLIPFIGVYGALIANVLSYLSIAISKIWFSRKYVVFNVRWFSLIISFLILLSQSIIMTLNTKYSVIISFSLSFLLVLINMSSIINLIRICICHLSKLNKNKN